MGKGFNMKGINACAGCGGLVRTSDPRKVIDDKVYHLHCGFKEEEKNKTKQLFCAHCFKFIDGAYATLFVENTRLDFHLECFPVFKKEDLDANRIPKG